MSGYTKVGFDFESLPWLTNPRHQLDLKAVALGSKNLELKERMLKAKSKRLEG